MKRPGIFGCLCAFLVALGAGFILLSLGGNYYSYEPVFHGRVLPVWTESGLGVLVRYGKWRRPAWCNIVGSPALMPRGARVFVRSGKGWLLERELGLEDARGLSGWLFLSDALLMLRRDGTIAKHDGSTWSSPATLRLRGEVSGVAMRGGAPLAATLDRPEAGVPLARVYEISPSLSAKELASWTLPAEPRMCELVPISGGLLAFRHHSGGVRATVKGVWLTEDRRSVPFEVSFSGASELRLLAGGDTRWLAVCKETRWNAYVWPLEERAPVLVGPLGSEPYHVERWVASGGDLVAVCRGTRGRRLFAAVFGRGKKPIVEEIAASDSPRHGGQ